MKSKDRQGKRKEEKERKAKKEWGVMDTWQKEDEEEKMKSKTNK